MTLDPDEKQVLESIDRGEWKPVRPDELARMWRLARERLRATWEPARTRLPMTRARGDESRPTKNSPGKSR